MKLTKAQLKVQEAVRDRLKNPDLSIDDITWLYENLHEGAYGDVSRDAAYFTPIGLARDAAIFTRKSGAHIVDIAAGIGMLSYALITYNYYSTDPIKSITCIELNPAYYEIGKRLLTPLSAHTHSNTPIQINYLNGNIFDRSVWTSASTMVDLDAGKWDVAVSNPPFGNMSPEDKDFAKGWLKYQTKRDVASIELAWRMAKEANYILPRQSVEFRYSGNRNGFERCESKEVSRLRKLNPDMFLAMEADGIDGSYYREDWRSTTITTEVASMCFDRSQYEPQ